MNLPRTFRLAMVALIRDLAGHRLRAGAIAGCGSSRDDYADSAGACRIRNTGPGAAGNPGSGSRPFGRACSSSGSGGNPGDTTPGCCAASDGRRVWRTNHANPKDSRHR